MKIRLDPKRSIDRSSANKPVTIKFDVCSDCGQRFDPYDTQAYAYDVAYCLGKENIPDKIMMREFTQRSSEVVKQIKARKIRDPRDIFKQYQIELERLSDCERQVRSVYELRYRGSYPFVKCKEQVMVTGKDNPLLDYREYIHRKFKRLYHK